MHDSTARHRAWRFRGRAGQRSRPNQTKGHRASAKTKTIRMTGFLQDWRTDVPAQAHAEDRRIAPAASSRRNQDERACPPPPDRPPGVPESPRRAERNGPERQIPPPHAKPCRISHTTRPKSMCMPEKKTPAMGQTQPKIVDHVSVMSVYSTNTTSATPGSASCNGYMISDGRQLQNNHSHQAGALHGV